MVTPVPEASRVRTEKSTLAPTWAETPEPGDCPDTGAVGETLGWPKKVSAHCWLQTRQKEVQSDLISHADSGL